MSKFAESIMKGLQEALDDAEGKRSLPRNTYNYVVPTKAYSAEEIKDIRNKLGMSQQFFADFMGVSKKTVEAWEAGKNKPIGPARRIFSMVQADPSILERCHIVEK